MAKKTPRSSPKTSPTIRKKTAKKRKTPERDSYHLPVRSESEQFEGLPEDLLEAWRQLRRFLISLGDQEIRTSHRSIMFAPSDLRAPHGLDPRGLFALRDSCDGHNFSLTVVPISAALSIETSP